MSKMKHLLKKLHIHNGRNPSSNPEARSQISNELVVEQRNTHVVDLGNSSSSSAAPGNSMNFCMMEEEYQVQLALAISASDANEDTESVQIKAVKRMSLGCSPSPETTLVEFLSSQYWRHNVVNYDEKILDGFYDVLGAASHSALQGKILSLAELQSPSFACYSDCEVVLVNRVLDPALQMLEQRAVGLASESRYAELGLLTSCLAQKIADLVVDSMGGPVVDADVMWRRWKYGSNRLKTSVRSVVLPIGCLQVGLSRHRALLFKVLADLVNLPCRLVKGSCYTGSDDGAVNIIKIDDGSEFMIDLMGAPGALIPLEIYDNQAFHEDAIHSDAISQTVRDISSTLDGSSQDLVRGVNPASSSEFNSNQTVPPNSGVGSVFGESVSTDMHLLYNGTIEGRQDDFKNMFPDVLLGFAVNPEYAQESLTSNVNGVHPTDLISVSYSPDLGNPIVQSKRSCHSEESLYEAGNLSSPFHAEIKGHELTYPYVDSTEASQRPTDPSTLSYVANGFGCTTSVPFVPINLKERTSQATANPFVQFDDSSNIDTAKMRSGERRCQQNIQGVGENHMPQVKGAAANCYNNRFSEMLDDVADCEIPWEDLQIGVRIGLGSYGEVYHADWNGKEVAVKKFLDQDFSGDAIEQFRCEVKIMQRLKHPNVVVFVGAVTQPPNLSILTEYLPRGSLFKLLHRVQIDEKRRLKMALDVAKGMYYLHTSNPTIVHRDLKSPNLLVDKNWVVKVCDFGLSRLKHHTFLSSKSNAGTPEWMAPEVLRNEPSNEKCDVYSFGVILWELATLRVPWSGMNPMQVVGAVGFQNRRPDIPENVDPTLTKIISDCWESDPNLRPSFAQLMTRLKGLQRLIVENV